MAVDAGGSSGVPLPERLPVSADPVELLLIDPLLGCVSSTPSQLTAAFMLGKSRGVVSQNCVPVTSRSRRVPIFATSRFLTGQATTVTIFVNSSVLRWNRPTSSLRPDPTTNHWVLFTQMFSGAYRAVSVVKTEDSVAACDVDFLRRRCRMYLKNPFLRVT